MSRSRAGSFLTIALALAIAGCGDDDDGATTPVVTLPNVSGRYFGEWTLHVLRKSDGFEKFFWCHADVTLQQSGTSGSSAVISGWASFHSPCAPASYELRGLVTADGAVSFVADGPAPPEGPCPGGKSVSFSGQTTLSNLGYRLSARGVANVTCPPFGEHQFTYIADGWRVWR